MFDFGLPKDWSALKKLIWIRAILEAAPAEEQDDDG